MAPKTASLIFAENLVRFRKQKGLSQYDLADMTGISRRSIGHYENEGILPPMDKLEAIAAALGVKLPRLFDEDVKEANPAIDLTGIDSRSVKKLKDILSLSTEDRNDLYRILNKMLRKNQLEQESHSPARKTG